MALAPGTRLGPYEIGASIGAGGMGEVYRATDANLKRDVAIKVLPESFASDAGRLARFQREAEVLASLNHVNIAHVYGLERGGGTTALAMELVEGPTLAERIKKGPIPVEEALGIARQIADALEAAHARGIVHRDLKPANVKLAPEGVVKVLDFGIAKALDTRVISGSPAAPSLTTPAMTQAGIVLGTAQYMSPEQARGKAVDQRADIWAFGCVLYEMITGQPAFSGEDVTVVLARVLERAADLSALRQSVSEAVQQTIKLCLQKDPKKRIADIRDVRLALEGAFETPAQASATSPSIASPARIVATIAVLVAAALVVPATRHLRETPAPTAEAAVARVELNIPAGVELYSGGARNVGVSPDGARVAYIGIESAVRAVYVRRLDEFETTRLRGTETATECCAFSPDGRALAYVEAGGAIHRVSLADGFITPLAGGSVFDGLSWESDDSILFVQSQALWRVPASGGEPTQITLATASGNARRLGWPTLLPDGKAILFASGEVNRSDWRIESVDLATGERDTVVERGSLPIYMPSGHLLFYRDDELLAAPFDAATRRVTGETVRILANLPEGGRGVPFVDVARAAGTLVYAPVAAATRLVWVSRDGREEPMLDTPRVYQNPRLDPQGRWIIVQAVDLWLQDLARATFTRIAMVPAQAAFPQPTPDGERVIYTTDTGVRATMLDGSGRSEMLAGTSTNDFTGSVSPDGELLLFVRLGSETSGDIYQANLSGDADVRPFLQTPAYEGGAKLSPDGRWLLYTSNDSGQMEVYLRPFPAPDQRWQVSTQGGTQPTWNPNGREIFYRAGIRMMAVAVTMSDAGPVLAAPVVLFEQPYAYGTGISIPNYDVAPDGQRFLMVKEDPKGEELKLILNWTQELERLAPTP